MSIEQLRFVERDGKKVLQQWIIVQIYEPSMDKEGMLSIGKITWEELRWEDVPSYNELTEKYGKIDKIDYVAAFKGINITR